MAAIGLAFLAIAPPTPQRCPIGDARMPSARHPALSSRRAVLVSFGAVAASAAGAGAYDMEDDEIPYVTSTSGMKKRSKPGEAGGKTYTAADGAYAFADIIACRSGLGQIENLVRSGEFGPAASLLGQPPFSSFKQNALVLVNSRVLAPEDIKAIGTEKRFGVGADALIMIGGLSEATEKSDRVGALDYAEKAKASIDEIIAIGKGAGL